MVNPPRCLQIPDFKIPATFVAYEYALLNTQSEKWNWDTLNEYWKLSF